MNDFLNNVLILLSGVLLSATITLVYSVSKQEKTQEDCVSSKTDKAQVVLNAIQN